MKAAGLGALVLVVTLFSLRAHAQRYVQTGSAQVHSGLEGGGGRKGAMDRARTRLRVGGELSVDEFPADIVGAAFLVDLEPRTAFGLDLRYTRLAGARFAVSCGAIGYLAPGTLLGPTASLEYRHPWSRALWLTAGPEANVFVVGVDLPDRTVLWQALLHVGIRVGL